MFTGVGQRYSFLFQLILTLLALVFIFPLAVMVMVSLRGEGLGNYLAVLRHPMIPRFWPKNCNDFPPVCSNCRIL